MAEGDHLTEALNQTQTTESTLCTMGISNMGIPYGMKTDAPGVPAA